MATKEKVSREAALLQEIADLRAGVAVHEHRPRDGSDPFKCTSPYCEDLGGPSVGPPPAYEPTDRYRREY